MNITFWQLAWQTLWRDLRAGQLRLLILAVTLAVAALTAVGFFADRLKSGMQRDARQLLGGDAVIVSDQPTPAGIKALVQSHGLQAVTTLSFPTMARAGEAQGGAARLVALKAVETGYPLRGQLTVSAQLDAVPAGTREIPAPGAVWVDPALLEVLGLQVGDQLLLGEAALRIARLIVIEPDRGAGFINFAPRAMINGSDLAATGLVQPASRVTWRYAVAGEDQTVNTFVRQAKNLIEREHLRGISIEALQGGRPEMAQTLERAEKFLNLVALLAALLSAVAVALAARTFANARLDDCAMLRVLGLSQATIARSHALEFLLVGL
ncbi:MAG: ABC transporter permease, partial [Gammaproteobacteria bacterium]|nr:ABC transporter permease [Gammaproteobacteria bacterium]